MTLVRRRSFEAFPTGLLKHLKKKVSMVVDGKADQTDVEALKAAMDRLDATIAAKAKGSSATAARDAEALGALQAAFKDMSTSMEGSMRKLQQVCLFQWFSIGRPFAREKGSLSFACPQTSWNKTHWMRLKKNALSSHAYIEEHGVALSPAAPGRIKKSTKSSILAWAYPSVAVSVILFLDRAAFLEAPASSENVLCSFLHKTENELKCCWTCFNLLPTLSFATSAN